MRILCSVFAVSFTLTGAFAQTTWYVDRNSPAPGDGSAAHPYPQIQYAVDRPTTLAGDTLLVLPGTYAENIDFHGKNLILIAQQGRELTRIDGKNFAPVVSLVSGEGTGTRIEGFTLSNGRGLRNGGSLRGGGIHCIGSEVEIVSCTIRENYAEFGGGMFADSAVVTLNGCDVAESTCGGGISAHNSILTMHSSTIRDHDEGGCEYSANYVTTGLTVSQCTTSIVDCAFRNNCQDFGEDSLGSAMTLDGGWTSIDSTIVEGMAWPCGFQGSSVLAHGGILLMQGCSLLDNSAEYRGGALALYGGSTPTDVTVISCTFTANESWDEYWGGTIYVDGGNVGSILRAQGSLIEDSDSGGGGAAWIGAGTAAFEDCTFRGNETISYYYEGGNGAGLWVHDGASVDVNGCLFEENVAWGGIYADDSEMYWLAGRGAGVYVHPGGSATIRRSTFVDNHCTGESLSADIGGQGAGVYGPAAVQNCTFYRNVCDPYQSFPGEGGGVSGAALNSCIVWENEPDSLAQGTLAEWSDVEGGWLGAGNFDLDPLFWGPEHGDLHLLPASPCIDAGDPALYDDDGSRVDVGAFPFDETYCGLPGSYCEAKQNSLGCLPSIGWSGTPRLGGVTDDFHVLATGVVPLEVGLLVWSTTGSAEKPFMGGTLCMNPPYRRSPLLESNGGSGGTCDCSFDFHFSQTYMQDHGLTPGTRLYLEFWYRDPLHPDGTGVGLTNALEATVCVAE